MTWNTVSLGSVCDVKTGTKDVNEGSKNGLYPFFTCAAKHTFSDVFSFDCEAILIAGNGAVGQTSYYNGKFEAYQRTYVLCNFIGILPQYLLYVLNGSLMYVLSSQVLGNTIPYIKKGMLTDFQVLLPPLFTQQNIVAKLDVIFAEIDKATAAAEANAKNAEALFQSSLSEIFEHGGNEWRELRIKDLGKVVTGNTPKTNEPENYGEYISFVKPGDFNSDGTIDIEKQKLSQTGMSKSRVIKENSALMVCIGATIGKCGFSEIDIVTNQQINSVTPTAEFNHKFIYFQMLTNDFQKKVTDGSGQATLPIINKSKWESLLMKIPPLKIQLDIVGRLDSLRFDTDNLKNSQLKKLQQLLLLKNSILKKAFNGELVKE